MSANLIKNHSADSVAICEEIEGTLLVIQAEREAKREGREDTRETHERWRALQTELGALETLYQAATGLEFRRPPLPPPRELEALEQLYADMGGARWTHRRGWTGRDSTLNKRSIAAFATNPFYWHGVDANALKGAVAELRLDRNNLEGVIGQDWLSAFPNLVVLSLAHNPNLHGPLPSCLSLLPQLEVLNISASQLSGSLPPSLGALSNLKVLELSHNRLEGMIPPELGSCTSLVKLNLTQNGLHGSVPRDLGNLTNLRELGLRGNNLEGEIPYFFCRLTALRIFDLSENRLSGPFPPWVAGCKALRCFRVNHNGLSGPLPEDIGQAKCLEVLQAHHNCMSGKLPPSLGKLSQLHVLNLGYNDFHGTIPPELGDLSSLCGLVLEGCFLQGPMPLSLGKLHKLVDFFAMDGERSYGCPVRRGFTRQAFERVFVHGPKVLGLNNANYPMGLEKSEVAIQRLGPTRD